MTKSSLGKHDGALNFSYATTIQTPQQNEHMKNNGTTKFSYLRVWLGIQKEMTGI